MSSGNSFGVVDKEYTGRRVTQQGPIAANQPIELPIYISDKQQVMVHINNGTGSRLLTVDEYEYSAGATSNLYLPTINVSASETVHVMFLGAVPYDQTATGATLDGNGKVVQPIEDSKVVIQQPFVGSVVRNMHDKNLETVSVKDFGAVGDGVTDDTAAIDTAMATNPNSNIFVPAGVYLVDDTCKNLNGCTFYGPGQIIKTDFRGGNFRWNTYTDTGLSFGKEYLYRVLKRIEVGGTLKAFVYGDSTTAMQSNGGGYGGLDTEPQNIIKTVLRHNGYYGNISITNRGVGGTRVVQMNAMPDIDTASGSTDLFIIKYGINDAQDGLAVFNTNLRAKLAEIRSNTFGTVNNLAIMLIGPSSTHDPAHGRSSTWYEQLRGLYVSAARDYRCYYFDTYQYLRDSGWGATHNMDNPFGDGQTVHPLRTMQGQIWAGVFNDAFSSADLSIYGGVVNTFTKNFWYPLSIGSTYSTYGNGFGSPQIMIDSSNNVKLRGVIKPTIAGTVPAMVAHLPNAVFAPKNIVLHPVISSHNTGKDGFIIGTDGTITTHGVFNTGTQYISLDGVTWTNYN